MPSLIGYNLGQHTGVLPVNIFLLFYTVERMNLIQRYICFLHETTFQRRKLEILSNHRKE